MPGGAGPLSAPGAGPYLPRPSSVPSPRPVPMSLSLLAAVLACSGPGVSSFDTIPAPPAVSVGRARAPRVDVPRVDDPEIAIDGRIDEAAWGSAAVLSGFTQFEPAEGAPASERTEVLVLHTASDLYVAVRAAVRDPATLRSTLAERDQIGRDDQIQLLLDTFRDRQRAYSLAVNPLGIQQDGVYTESTGGNLDTSPDFLFASRGRVTPEGFEVELRIPFKSLKFSGADEQAWGFHVIRRIAATGAVESWAPLSRADASWLRQAGELGGMRDLRPGTLLQVNPTLTGRRDGVRLEDGRFRRERVDPDVGVNLKYGLTSEVTLDATVNPDFSQVEADADQITVNERFALSLEEKRPFFLEGADLFRTQESLVYTRSIVDPAAGVKLTGRAGSLSLAYLGAVDEASRTNPDRFAPRGERAVVQIARVRRDVGSAGSSIGFLATSREVGDAFNRVAAVDARVTLSPLYVAGVQAGGSWTREWRPSPVVDPPTPETVDRRAHLARAFLDRTGRRWGFLLQLRDIPEDFVTRTGFLRRTGITELWAANRLSWYGAAGALVERVDLRQDARRFYDGRDFWKGRGPMEGSLDLELDVSLRRNVSLELGYGREFFTLDADDYAGYEVPAPGGGFETGAALVAASGTRPGGLDGVSFELSSSTWKWIDLGVGVEYGETVLFDEGVRGHGWGVEVEAALRPTEALRVDARLGRETLYRDRDGSRYSDAIVPRLRVEYQLARAVAVRALVQYAVEEVDVLRTPDGRPYLRDGAPFRDRRGGLRPEDAPQLNPLRMDLLFSYQPSPGTVFFLGYGREVSDDGAFRFDGLAPRNDGLFLKVSYLFQG